MFLATMLGKIVSVLHHQDPRPNSPHISVETEFVPTHQLINELMGRKNFVGVIVYSEKENRQGIVHGDGDFRCITTMDSSCTVTVMSKVIDQLNS